MVPSSLIETFNDEAFVIHPSLLPKYRGANPIQGALLGGEETTGVTVVGMSRDKFDAGKIYFQEVTPIEPSWVFSDLRSHLGERAEESTAKFLENYRELVANGRPQNLEQSNYAKKSGKDSNLVKVKEEESETVFRKYRAFTGSPMKFIKIYFPSENQFFYVKKMNVCREGLKQTFELNFEVDEENFETGAAIPGFGPHNKSFFLKCKRGWVQVLDGYFANLSNFNFDLTLSRVVSRTLKDLLKKAHKNKGVQSWEELRRNVKSFN